MLRRQTEFADAQKSMIFDCGGRENLQFFQQLLLAVILLTLVADKLPLALLVLHIRAYNLG